MDGMNLEELVCSVEDRVVAVEYENGQAVLFRRLADGTVREERRPFAPFALLADAGLADGLGAASVEPLAGPGTQRTLVTFADAASYEAGLKRLKAATGVSPSSPGAPYRVFGDLCQQMLTRLRLRLFRGMAFEELRRLQLDIETHCGPGHRFCDAACPEDEVTLVSLRDSDGFEVCLSNREEGGEAALLTRMMDLIQERDPDVIEGHNIFNFDLAYIETRCRRLRLPLRLGRGGRVCRSRASRFSAGERQITYQRLDIFGRHVVDTYFLVMLHDIVHRDLDSYGLKACARHFGVAAPNRTYVPGQDISSLYETAPETLKAYCLDDVRETDALSRRLSPSYFYQAQLVPLSYQSCLCRGNATRIDALLCAEYLSAGLALPEPQPPQPLQGALSESLVSGVFRDVWHIDVRSLYPSIVCGERLTPASDHGGAFLRLLERLREFRLRAKDAMRAAPPGPARERLAALQSSFKILINSFYGYTAFAQGTFNDYGLASRITARGRDILSSMRDFLQSQGARIIEMDTDGLYFTPPPGLDSTAEMAARVQATLPPGIEVDLDATYVSMFSYKAKNYALLEASGEVRLSGAALKSRGLEPFQRRCIREVVTLLLEGRAAEVPPLWDDYARRIRERTLPLEDFVQRENLTISPEAYAQKLAKGTTRRSAAYELALRADTPFRQGDSVQFYVTGTRRKCAVVDNCRLYEGVEPETRDENTAYYLDKLGQLKAKFDEALPGLSQTAPDHPMTLFPQEN